jgi:hypothetical protein
MLTIALGFLRAVPARVWLALGLVAATWALHAWDAAQHRQEGRSEVQAKWDARELEIERQAASDRLRTFNRHSEIVNERTRQIARERAAAAAAVAAGDSLRDALAAAHAARCTAAAGGGAAAGTAADLPALVQRRLDEATEGIARHADDARGAGRTCEQSYDALKP